MRTPVDPDRAVPSPRIGPTLVRWFLRHRRALPWRRDRDPYRLWVAEVLLQQTRVPQAVPYYERFLAEFPSVAALSAAPLERVLKVWQGAGYYARARHLHAAANELVREHGGRLPTTVEELERLPGIGPYIARSLAALAYGAPTIALEANGARVAARWLLESGEIRSSEVRRRLVRALEAARGPAAPGPFNEALMELGETVCRPVQPRCEECPVRSRCRAYRELEDPGSLPPRRSVRARPHVRGAVVVLEDDRGRWLVQRRAPTGLLGGLWEFPGGKVEPGESTEHAAERELLEETGLRAKGLESVGVVRHAYSHFTVELEVFRGRAETSIPSIDGRRRWVTRRELTRLAIPKATEKALALLRGEDPDTASRGSGSRPGHTPPSPARGAPLRGLRVRGGGTPS